MSFNCPAPLCMVVATVFRYINKFIVSLSLNATSLMIE